MKIITVDVLPKCDFCTKNAMYDAPLLRYGGSWANVCKGHAAEHHANFNIGSKFVLRQKTTAGVGMIVEGIEMTSLEELVTDNDREIKCPICKEIRTVEPDASYTYACPCGAQVKVKEIM